LRFWAPPPIGSWLKGNVHCHLRLIGKLVMDFLFVLVKLCSPDVTTEALRANIDWKSAFLKWVGQFQPNFHVVGDVSRVLHGEIDQWMPYNEDYYYYYYLLCRWQYLHKETFQQTFFEWSAILHGNGHFAFLSPPPSLRGLGTMYDVHLGLIGKLVVDFLLVLIDCICCACDVCSVRQDCRAMWVIAARRECLDHLVESVRQVHLEHLVSQDCPAARWR